MPTIQQRRQARRKDGKPTKDALMAMLDAGEYMKFGGVYLIHAEGLRVREAGGPVYTDIHDGEFFLQCYL